MVKKRGRTFRIRESFNDPYVSKTWIPGEDVEESDLLKSGWKPSDVDRAVGSLLIPHLLPKRTEEKTKTNKDGGEQAAEEVDEDG